MARFTVADCMEYIDNRFIMTLVAALRARQIEKGNGSLRKMHSLRWQNWINMNTN